MQSRCTWLTVPRTWNGNFPNTQTQRAWHLLRYLFLEWLISPRVTLQLEKWTKSRITCRITKPFVAPNGLNGLIVHFFEVGLVHSVDIILIQVIWSSQIAHVWHSTWKLAQKHGISAAQQSHLRAQLRKMRNLRTLLKQTLRTHLTALRCGFTPFTSTDVSEYG